MKARLNTPRPDIPAMLSAFSAGPGPKVDIAFDLAVKVRLVGLFDNGAYVLSQSPT